MAVVNILSSDDHQPFPFSKQMWREQVLPQIKRCEKKNFAAGEIFDFDSELQKKNFVLNAFVDNAAHLVGYMVLVRPKVGRSMTLHKICVQKTHRRRGIANMMLCYEIEKLKSMHCPGLHLWVRAENMAAKKLYESLSFETQKEVMDYYGAGRNGVHMFLNLDLS